MHEDKFDYFMDRTEKDIRGLEAKVDKGFHEVKSKMDEFLEFKIKITSQSALIAGIITVVGNLIVFYMGHN